MIEYMRNIIRHRRLFQIEDRLQDVIVCSEYLKICTAFASFCYGDDKDKLGDVLIKCQNGLEQLFPRMYSICIYVPVDKKYLKLIYETRKNNKRKIRILQAMMSDNHNFYVGILHHNTDKNAYINNFLLDKLKNV